MKLTDAELAMLDGHDGKARQRAMQRLVRYAEALGARRCVETTNLADAAVSGRWQAERR